MISKKVFGQFLPFLLSLISLQTIYSQHHSGFYNLKLEEALQLALANNKMLKIQTIRADVAKLKEKDLKYEKFPDIGFRSSFHVLSNINQFEDGWGRPSTSYEVPRIKYNFTLDASIPIYLGGKMKAEEDKAEIETVIAELKIKKEEREVKLKVITAYLGALHLEEQMFLLKEKMHEDSLVIHQTEKMQDNGAVTYNDVLRTKLQLSNHQMMYFEMEKEFDILVHQIKTILALHDDVPFSISTDNLLKDTLYTGIYNDLVEQAYAQNESFQITKKETEIAIFDKKLIRANYLPKFTANGEYGYSYPNFMFFPPVAHLYRFGLVGVNLTLPLSNFYKNNPKIKMANKNISIAKLEVEEKEEQIRHDVFSAYKRIEEIDVKIKIALQAIEQAQENYRIVKVKYGNQLSLITELIDADNSYLEAQSNLISLQINKQLKYYQLQYILGNI